MARWVVGVAGGVAAYKAVDVASRLVKEGHEVRAVLSEAAARFVAPLTFEAVTGRPALVDLWAPGAGEAHIELARWCDGIVVAPATADLLGQLANGLARDALGAVLLAARAPVWLAPAMHDAMWRHPAVQANVERLRQFGYRFIGPEHGRLASGEEGWGRMAEPAAIVEALRAAGRARDLSGRRVLVTAGPTQEPLDPVRYLSNHSSGKMGWALAEAARDRGAQVTLVAGPVALPDPQGIDVVRVRTAAEMLEAVRARFASCDALVAAAAVADYRPKAPAPLKIKKSEAALTVELVRNPDVLEEMGKAKGRQVLVGFKAETGPGLEAAREMLRRKNLDLVVLNDVTEPGAGFGTDTNHVVLVSAEGEEALPLMGKREVAERIWDAVVRRLERQP
ncbi:MAG: bifunctional phosphopantothenoylcysteine decarboxylase/phosphopantothenate--cysteine ligase CoaBC [Firmicutes bacterium]|nr:bifunctional phosphopantothenoylcysteine decarboxylase/phosphopantothenate--cysteine ligase CoaBC [Bacillota bacterium]